MWRIPAFLAAFAVAFFAVGLGSLALVQLVAPWLGVAVGVVGISGVVALVFPTLNWVIDGRWGWWP